jgi:geranylgeranyl pyrophosphate synthase
MHQWLSGVLSDRTKTEQRPERLSVEVLRRILEERLRSATVDIEARNLQHAVARGIVGGKRMRSLLTMMMCGAVGGRPLDALDPAVSVELLHAASLVHDDIMDGSELRRGAPTIHTAFGLGDAVLAGDMLTALSFRVLSSFRHDRERLIIQSLTDAFVHTCDGQGLDISLKQGDGERIHRTMVEKKTARLMQSAAEIGALVGTADSASISAAREFGFCMGMAYQAFDDYQDGAGSPAMTGKPENIDIRNGRLTFVTAENATRDRASVLSHVADYHHRALRSLNLLPETPWRQVIAGTASLLVSPGKLQSGTERGEHTWNC